MPPWADKRSNKPERRPARLLWPVHRRPRLRLRLRLRLQLPHLARTAARKGIFSIMIMIH